MAQMRPDEGLDLRLVRFVVGASGATSNGFSMTNSGKVAPTSAVLQ
jgi:hypothetical protein